MISKLQRNKAHITAHFKGLEGGLFTPDTLAVILEDFRYKDWAGERSTVDDLMDVLQPDSPMEKVELVGENNTITRYKIGTVADLDLLYSLSAEGYFSHATAMALNGITDTLSPHVFLTREQGYVTPSKNTTLQQQNVTAAFAKPARLSNHVYRWNNYSAFLLYRKLPHHGVGVHKMPHTGYFATDLERTMLDVVVRPEYGGGPALILESFAAIKDRLDCKKLLKWLKKMSFTYPYHQSIGFYLQHAGYAQKQCDLFRAIPLNLDFYLENQMTNTIYDPSWRIFYPKGLKI